MKRFSFYIFVIIIIGVCSAYAENPSAVRCGTFVRQEHKPEVFELRKDIRSFDTLPEVFSTTNGKFLIHYGIGGKNGVSATDKNENGVPDYIDSVAYYLDYVYRLCIDTLKFKAAPEDGVAGGTSGYDVYITDLGNGEEGMTSYGYTTPEYNSTSKKTSWLVIDNNYSAVDKTIDGSTGKQFTSYLISGIDALKITLVHEYHHAIQFGYGEMNPYLSMFLEMTSSYMEYRAFPGVQYYVLYINKMLGNLSQYPFSSADANLGYAWSALPIKLYEEYRNDSLILDLWNNIEYLNNGFMSLNNTLLKFTGNDISEQIQEVGEWLYYTGDRAQNGKYYSFADKLDGITYEYEDEFSSPSVMRSGSLYPLAFYPSRIVFPGDDYRSDDTLDILIYNSKLPNFYSYYQNAEDFCFSLGDKSSSSGCDSLVLQSQYCFFSTLNSNFMKPVMYEHNGIETVNGEYVFPNPLTGNDDFMAFPVKCNVPVGSKIRLSISDMNDKLIYDKDLRVELFGNAKTAFWREIPESISSGVYLYKIKYGDTEHIGKFAVKR